MNIREIRELIKYYLSWTKRFAVHDHVNVFMKAK